MIAQGGMVAKSKYDIKRNQKNSGRKNPFKPFFEPLL